MSDPHERLKRAREAAGFATANEAVERFGWKYPTYSAHENGHRGMKPDAITRYSRAFRVDEAWLQFGKRDGSTKPTSTATDEARPAGFSDPVAEPYVARSKTEKLSLEALAAQLVPNAKSTALFRLNQTLLDFALLRGDILILDLNPAATDGALSLINVVDANHGTAETAICRRYEPHLVYPANETRNLPARMSTDTVVVLGEVRGSFRPDIS